MDTDTRREPPHPDVVTADPARGDAADRPVAPAVPAQQELPFDDESDQPIPYALTARARRTVAPASLPALRIVGGDPDGPDGDPGGEADPHDTRPARARALRRAGLDVRTIASRLSVDDLLVRAWVGETLTAVLPEPTDGASARGGATADGAAVADGAAGEIRRLAAAGAAVRLQRDPAFAAGVGLLTAVSEADAHALTLAGPRAEVVVRALGWLRTTADLDDRRVRVVLRVGRAVAADASRHEWATRLRVPVTRVTVTRWAAPPFPTASEVLVRVRDPQLAARVGGWCDALLAGAESAPAEAF
ncbi:hypothetical protein [Egicoccus halophilus]|uniref:Uncharacterized protein n=1 Tax=Egicoccus halophilus TaxID=1670830 RepID=A0A8J3EZ36_9ACTN|nr:hypothetical protein [Egicoccus halophilus]GGI09104.1 hypothetical protein GCM10011354_32420 [Egicoccus halophilus]